MLAVAGVLAAIAIVRLPGHGGHIPYEGIKAGTAQPTELPGTLLAALATLGLGLVLGPEAPLIALEFAIRVARAAVRALDGGRYAAGGGRTWPGVGSAWQSRPRNARS